MAPHGHHDQLSTTWLLDTGSGYQSFVPKVSAHYEGENILFKVIRAANNKKRIRTNSKDSEQKSNIIVSQEQAVIAIPIWQFPKQAKRGI